MDLNEVWRLREDEVYPRLFGGERRGIFPLAGEVFRSRFDDLDIDLTWLFVGVFEFSPTAQRPFWLYVTSGLSTPWYADSDTYHPGDLSGEGVEYLFATTVPGDWAIRFLQNMLAFDLVLASGQLTGQPLGEGDRIPLREPINGLADCQITNAILTRSDHLPTKFQLPSGEAHFLTFTGVTDEEIAFAKRRSTAELVGRLVEAAAYPVTDPSRASVI